MSVKVKNDKWVRRWQVPKSSGEGNWTVAIDKDGNYGCSCPRWKFKREECKHILEIKQNGGEEVKNLSEKERAELKLKAYAEKGYRYHTWHKESLFSRNRQELEELKHNPDIESVRTFGDGRVRIIVIKEKESAYQKEFDNFLDLLKKCNLRRKYVKNPFYETIRGNYWLTQKELRDKLHLRWFDIVQHIIYNKTGIVNPNLPEGSVYSRGKWGRKIIQLEKHFKFLK